MAQLIKDLAKDIEQLQFAARLSGKAILVYGQTTLLCNNPPFGELLACDVLVHEGKVIKDRNGVLDGADI